MRLKISRKLLWAFAVLWHLMLGWFLSQQGVENQTDPPLEMAFAISFTRGGAEGIDRVALPQAAQSLQETAQPLPSPMPGNNANPQSQTSTPRVSLDEVEKPAAEQNQEVIGLGQSHNQSGGSPRPAASSSGAGLRSTSASRQKSLAYENRTPAGRRQAIAQYGGSSRSEDAVEKGLRWLARHQEANGGWSASQFTRHCQDSPCTGIGFRGHEAALTGLCLMAFLGAGHTPTTGAHRLSARRALDFLLREQNAEGFFGAGKMYNHGIVLLALVEAYGQTGDARLTGPIVKAIAATAQSQQAAGGWTYEGSPSTHRSDSSITGWQLLALAAANRAGFAVHATLWQRGMAFLQTMTDSSGKVRYADTGPSASRQSDALLAVVLLCSYLFPSAANPTLQKHQLAYLQTHPPDWQKRQSLDNSMYYWYHGTLAAFVAGDPYWKTWNGHLREMLIAHQVKQGEAAGSWEPSDPWGGSGGRIYATAINILNLEIYYRYQPRFLPATLPKPAVAPEDPPTQNRLSSDTLQRLESLSK